MYYPDLMIQDKKGKRKMVNKKMVNKKMVKESKKNIYEYKMTTPLFINFYKKTLSSDYMLNNYLKQHNVNMNGPTVTNNFKNYTQVNNFQFDQYLGSTPTSLGPKKTSIFIFPDIGASSIYGIWNKSNDSYIKQLDAYGNFEYSEKWKCKTTQQDWTKLWFPFDKTGHALSCWSQLVKMDIDKTTGLPVNSQGVITKLNDNLNDIGNPLEVAKEPYDVLLRTLSSLGYVHNSNLFIINYDFRKITSDIYRVLNSVSSRLSDNREPVIFITHGLGTLIANYCIQNGSFNVNRMICLAPTIGGVPKALRVLVSGDTVLNSNYDQKSLSRTLRMTTMNYDGLYMMLPISDRYNNKLFQISKKVYGKESVPAFISAVFGSGLSGPTTETGGPAGGGGGSDPEIINLEKISEFIRKTSMDPKVPVFILAGTGVPTESDYIYEMNSFDDPKISKGYSGDGTVPVDIVTDLYNKWSSTNPNVLLKLYTNADHIKLLMLYEPMKDLIEYLEK